MRKTWILVLVALWASPSVAEGPFSRTAAAISTLVRGSADVAGWVLLPPVVVEGGDYEALCVSVLAPDPARPAFVVRFQATDGKEVGESVKPGVVLKVLRYELDTGGPLPVYVVGPSSGRGWRTKVAKGSSETLALWGYLVGARAAAAGGPAYYARFFGALHGTHARVLVDLEKMIAAAIPEKDPPTEIPAPVATPLEVTAKPCEESEAAIRMVDRCEATILEMAELFDKLAIVAEKSPAADDVRVAGRKLFMEYALGSERKEAE